MHYPNWIVFLIPLAIIWGAVCAELVSPGSVVICSGCK